jgi:recombination protein RecR
MAMMTENGQNLGPIAKLVQELSRLPGIGPKSAERLTFHLIGGDRKNARDLAAALQAVAEIVHTCPECGNLADGPLCAVCSNPRRDPALLCVVETPRDLAVFERAGFFRGRYHVLGGRLAPLDNMGPERLTTESLLRRVQQGGVQEVILATSPTLEGDGTALYVSNLLAPTGVKITRLARGLPSGTSLDLVNAQMLSDAVEGRRAF